MRITGLTMALLATFCVRAHAQADSAQVAADANAQVTIVQSSGTLVVTAVDAQTVAVRTGTRLTHDALQGGGARIDVAISGKQSVELRVPRYAQLRILAGNSAVIVRGVSGTVDVEASGGIEIMGTPQSIHAAGFSGQVTIRGGGTEMTRAESVGGAVTIAGARGIVEARSSTGMVSVSGDVREATLFSVSGSIRFDGSITRGGRLTAESTSGRIDLRLPRRTAAAFEFSTVTGSMNVDFEQQQLKLSPPYESRTKPGVRLAFTVGNGAGRVKAASVTGDIILVER